MKILIVGCGFIGHWVASYLSEEHDVYVITKSNILTNRTKYLTKARVETHVDSTINVSKSIYSLVHFDAIIYTASSPNAADIKEHFVEYSPSIIQGPVNCIKNLITKHFIYLSSSMVYGDFNGIPNESHPLNPIDPYGNAKMISEYYVKYFCNDMNIPYTIIRPSAVYGPRDKIHRVVSRFLYNSMHNKNLIVRGDQLIDFTYITDLVHGIELSLNKEAYNQTFNISYGEGVPLFAVAAKIIKETGKGVIEREDRDKLYPIRGALDISKAKKILGYNPKIDITRGIELYYEDEIKQWI